MKQDKKINKYTSIGGQALIEGIMMKGPKKVATVIRKPDGTLVKKVELSDPIRNKYPILKLPFIRGVYIFLESMISGIKAINYSGTFFELEEEQAENEIKKEPSKFEKFLDEKLGDKMSNILIFISMVLGIALSVLLFIILPTFIIGLFGDQVSFVAKNLLEGALRIAIFILYIYLVSKMKDIKRVFMYHGAEHKTIFCFEKKEELTVENVRKYPRLHPRCGTSFLLIVMVISIFVFSFLKWNNVFERSLTRILLMPVVMAISYEIIKLAAKYDNIFTRMISAPGMWLQKLTTQEPEDSMIEVAITGINLVRNDEKEEQLEDNDNEKKTDGEAVDN